ncbi:MAG: hypothetical protein R2743_03720 [Ilumatobacteraceae bacterium]
MRRTILASAAVAALLLAACSSTEQDEETVATSATAAATSDAPDADPSGTSDAPTGTPDTTDPGEPAPTTEPATTIAAEPPRGVDGDVVRVGFVVIVNQQAATEQAGGSGVTTIEQEVAVQLLVDDLNARGGLGGLTVEPVLFEIDATASTDPQEIARAYCATFTQDNEVYAVLGAGEPGPEQRACLDEAAVPAFVAGGTIAFLDDEDYDALPYLVNVNGISLDAAAQSMVAGLDAAGFFADDSTVGILRLQSPAFDRATETSLLPALAELGVEPAAEVAIAAIESQDDIGRVSTEAQAAVLRMKDAGVDRLIVFESGGALPFFFQSAAGSQSYAPQLAFGSTSGGQTLVQNLGTGGTLVGWSPIDDVPVDAAPAQPPRAQECLDLLDPTGAAFTSAVATGQALAFCDTLWLLDAAVGGELGDADTLMAAVAGLGDGYASATLEQVTFGDDKRWGTAQYRIADYDPSCACNVYRADSPTPLG